MNEQLIYFLFRILSFIGSILLLFFIIKLFYGLFLLIISIVYKNPKSKAISYIIKSFISIIIVFILWVAFGILKNLLWTPEVSPWIPILEYSK